MRLHPQSPWLALGMTSLVLGFIGLSLFFLPVLGIPISIAGLGLGVIGAILALFGTGPALRWSLGGIALCLMSLSVNLAITWAPSGYLPQPAVPKPWQPASDAAQVSPPADL